MRFEGRYNPKTLKRERVLKDKRSTWWVLGLAALFIFPVATGSSQLLSIATIALIYAAINVMWTLIIGTAGILSLASLATVGVGAFAATYFSVNYHFPWPIMLAIGTGFGLLLGFIVSLPVRRLDGMYYALLTLGVTQLLNDFVSQSSALGSGYNGSMLGADQIIPDTIKFARSGETLGFIAAFIVLLLALTVFRWVNGGRLGLTLRAASTSTEDESFVQALGVNIQRDRTMVFLIASAALGFIGGFYATYTGGASVNLFSLDQLLLLLAMLVIGGIGRAEGAVVGTVIVVTFTEWFSSWGPWRILIVGALMLASVLITRAGLFGTKNQFEEFRERRKALSRSSRSSRYSEYLPEEAPEIHDKQVIVDRSFERNLRIRLRGWITPEAIEEHRRKPLGQHSDHLERMLNYFRRTPLANKYAVRCDTPFERYRVVALSGQSGVPPRLVDDKIYGSLDEAYHAVFLRRVNDLSAST